MAPAYKEENYLIIQPGSQTTLVKFGLDDTLSPPTYSIPTLVYKNQSNPQFFTMTPNSDPVYPIVKGFIKDSRALNFLLKSILKSILSAHPLVLLSSIPLVLIQTSANWSHSSIESITNYVFESLSIPALSIVPSSLCSLFAYGSPGANACVVDVGFEKTEISVVLDYQLFIPSNLAVPYGGNSINERLQRVLPQLDEIQVEILKRSNVFEVLNAEDASKSFFGIDALLSEKGQDGGEDDGVLDIAAIVTSEKSTREILAEKELKSKKSAVELTKPNSEVEINSFIDNSGSTINVGKERFQGSTELINAVAKGIYRSIGKVGDLKKAQDCYDNLIFTGQTTKIKGFKEALFFKLYCEYVVGFDQTKKQNRSDSTFRNNTSDLGQDLGLVQVPKHLKLATKPEYFSEWKKFGFEDCSFLGGEILAKMVYGNSNNSELYLSKEEYLEKGPMGIWHVKM